MIDYSKNATITLILQRRQKNNPVVPLAIAQGIGGVLGLLGSYEQSSTAKYINSQNIAMQRETNALNERLFNQNLDWSERQREEQNVANMQNAIRMFDIENEYNKPSSQVSRMIAAGLNPAALAGASAAGNGSQSAPSVGASSGVSTPQIVSPRMEMYTSASQQALQNMQTIASSIGQLAQASQSDAYANESKTLLTEKLRNLKLTDDQLEIQKDLLIEFGSKTKQAEYDLLTAEFAKKQSEILLNGELTATEKEKQMQLVADSLLKDSERFLNKKEYDAFDKKLSAHLNKVSAEIKLMGAQTFEANTGGKRNLAQAHLFNEEALTEDSIRQLNDSMTNLNNARKSLTQTEGFVAQRSAMYRIQQEFEKLTNMRYLNAEAQSKVEIAKAEMEQAMYANDMKAFTFWSNFAFNIFDRGVSLLTGAKGLPQLPWTHDAVTHDSEETYIESNTPYYNSSTGETGVHKSHKTTKKYGGKR